MQKNSEPIFWNPETIPPKTRNDNPQPQKPFNLYRNISGRKPFGHGYCAHHRHYKYGFWESVKLALLRGW